jgi:electron transfer flavoprotein alpha/beta subunit
MNIAVLVKQVGADDGLTMDALSRRAVAQGVELAAAVGDGVCTAIAAGPPSAEDVLREAIAWGRISSVMTFGVLVLADSASEADTLGTARTLAAVLEREGPFDLVLLGRRSEDGGTGQLGAQVAELLDLPFVASARFLSMQRQRLHVRGEHDNTWMQATVALPAVVSCAAGLIDPCDASADARDLVPSEHIRTVTAEEVGTAAPASPHHGSSGPIAVVADPAQPDQTAALIDAAVGRADETTGQVVVVTASAPSSGDVQPEDVAHAVADWSRTTSPSAVLVADTVWGQEVAGRVAARLGSMASITTIDPRSGGAAPTREPLTSSVTTLTVHPRNRVRVVSRTRRAD